MGDCTFKPVTLDYVGVGVKEAPTHGDKCLDLYSRVKKDQYKEKQNKSHVDYEFERMQEECLFTPKINSEEVPHEIEVS